MVSPLPLGGGDPGGFPWANFGIWWLIKDALCCILSNHKGDFEDRRSSFIYPFFDRFDPTAIVALFVSFELFINQIVSLLQMSVSVSNRILMYKFCFALMSLRFSVSVKLNSHYCHGFTSTAISGYCI